MLSIIVDIIGIAGFILSVINVFYHYISNRKRITICFGNYALNVFDRKNNKELLIIHFKIANLSQIPISITRIQILVNETLFDSDVRPHIAEEFTWSHGDKPYHSVVIESKILPININSLGAESGYIAFVVPRDKISDFEKALNFRICTNRGKAVQKTFSLHEDVRV